MLKPRRKVRFPVEMVIAMLVIACILYWVSTVI